MIYAFFTSKGYSMTRETFSKALARVEVDPGFPSDLVPGPAAGRGGASAREEDLGGPGLEEGAAPGLLGQGQQLAPRSSSPRIRSRIYPRSEL